MENVKYIQPGHFRLRVEGKNYFMTIEEKFVQVIDDQGKVYRSSIVDAHLSEVDLYCYETIE